MSLSKVHEDSVGVWVPAGGWAARPISETAVRPGDKVKASHRGGTILAAVTTAEGEKETWITLGIEASHMKQISQEDRKKWYEHVREEALLLYGHVYWKEESE